MATIEQNLERLNNVKTTWRQALEAQGQEVSENAPLESYVLATGSIAPNLQDKSITITQNGTTTISKDTGYDGLDEVEITTNVSGGGGTTVELELNSQQKGYSSTSSYPSRLAWYIRTIENLDIRDLSTLAWMFANCQHLITIPQLDTSNITGMSFMFYNCKSLTSIPMMNTSNVDGMSNMFYACEALTTIPQLDMSSVTSTQNMFYNCYALTTIPQLNTANVTNMNNMFYYCRALTSVPQLNTSNVTTMTAMFRNCQVLTSLPTIDTAKVTDMSDMFNGCQEIETITITDTPLLTKVSTAFYNCRKLKRINGILDITKCTTNTSLSNFLGSGINAPTLLEEVRIKGLRNTYNFSHLPNLSHDSLVYLINNLQPTTGTRTLTLGATNLARLSEEEKAVAGEKGWTLA